ncbi:MAG: hypothetical protein KF764_04845 [Labilithrix sp.]|nr:hypothetical protein [Labilithrix sp.]MBX3220846.1 hypothetical protein [Labilithrix sp.]
MDLRTSIPAAAVLIGCTLVVTVRAALAPAPVPRRPATPAELAEVAAMIASNERTWTTETAQNFPADRWSQRDDFHGREYRKAQEIANEKGLRIEDVLRAVDDDIHRRAARSPDDTDERSAGAIPCKPRPFYD